MAWSGQGRKARREVRENGRRGEGRVLKAASTPSSLAGTSVAQQAIKKQGWQAALQSNYRGRKGTGGELWWGGRGRKGRELARKGERGGKGRGKGRGRKGEEGERGGRRKKSRNRGEKGRREQILTRRLTHSQTMAEPTRSDLITDLWCEEPAKGTQGEQCGI